MYSYALFGGHFTDRIGGISSHIYDMDDLDSLKNLMDRLVERKVFDWLHIADTDTLEIVESWEASPASSQSLVNPITPTSIWGEELKKII